MIKFKRILQTLLCIPLCFVTCCSSKKSQWENYHELIKHIILKDEQYLIAFKKENDKNWSDKWKLVDFRIDDANINELARFVGKEKPIEDTSCVLDWNQTNGDRGVIRRETYDNLDIFEIKLQSTQLLLYKNDSIYAQGGLRPIMNSNLVLQNLIYLKEKTPCKPCSDFSFEKYFSMGAFIDVQHEEIQIIDSLGNIQCSYTSPCFSNVDTDPYSKELKISISSDTIITSNGSCKFVELKGK